MKFTICKLFEMLSITTLNSPVYNELNPRLSSHP